MEKLKAKLSKKWFIADETHFDDEVSITFTNVEVEASDFWSLPSKEFIFIQISNYEFDLMLSFRKLQSSFTVELINTNLKDIL
jgi:hypothetical protein